MRVAFVTTTDLAILHDDVDLPLQIAAFATAGIELEQVAWEDESADWESFDAVIIRTPWNYVDRLDEFREWLDRRRGNRRVHNPVDLIEWNLDKRYLSDLAHRGVPIVPTSFVDSVEQFHAAVSGLSSAEVVVKPSISAGSRMTGRFATRDPAAEALVVRILSAGLTAMIQPFAERIDDEGEIGTVLFDGSISHSFRKAALLGESGTFVGGDYREEITSVVAPHDVLDVVHLAAGAARAIAWENGWIPEGRELLYGRYDVIRLDDGSAALLEAELFEPCFFLKASEGSAERFVEAVRRIALRSH